MTTKNLGKAICLMIVVLAIIGIIFLLESDNSVDSPTSSTVPTPTPTPTHILTPDAIPMSIPDVVPTRISLSPSSPDPIPVTTFPKSTPTPTATTELIPTLPGEYTTEAKIYKTLWDENILVFIQINGKQRNWDTLDHLNYIEIYVDGQCIVEFKPTIVKGNTRMEIEECPMIINHPNANSCEITVIGSFDFSETGFDSGDYPIRTLSQTLPMRYEEEYNQCPIYCG